MQYIFFKFVCHSFKIPEDYPRVRSKNIIGAVFRLNMRLYQMMVGYSFPKWIQIWTKTSISLTIFIHDS
jgi:hypothetical protein